MWELQLICYKTHTEQRDKRTQTSTNRQVDLQKQKIIIKILTDEESLLN